MRAKRSSTLNPEAGKNLAHRMLMGTAWLMGTASLSFVSPAQQIYGEYPVPGRQVGTTAFSQEMSAQHQASSHYPAWFRGKAVDGKADESSRYFFTQLVGPRMPGSESGTSGFTGNNLRMGTLVLLPGATYPAHNHPAREVYYVTEGEADWFVDDEKQHVTPGSIIMHRPYAVHGWTNTSSDKPLKVIWIQWVESDERPDVLDKGARLVNPDIARYEITAKPFAVPLPPTHK
jgi:quercetin dioxygenase-like cupin family protein